MKRVLKSTISVLLACMIAFGFFCVNIEIGTFNKAYAASSYDPNKAISYAAANWNNGVGLCAEFVSNCLTAGGVNIMQKTVSGLKKTLVDGGYGTLCKLSSSTTQWGQVAKMSDNSGKVKVGDPLFTYCSSCGYTHAVICGGVDSSGYITIYAHNSAKNNQKYYADCTSHSSSYISIYSFSMNTTHTHDFSVYLWYWKEHPHYNEYKCSYCDAKEVRKSETNYVPSCDKCNHTHNYNTYSHFDTSHPHYSYNKCSCGDLRIDYSQTNQSLSCVWCNPSAFCANLGDDFYGLILNTACWKPISKTSGTNDISLQTENGSSMQKWRFQRQSDGAYVISSCYDGTVLEMTDGTRVTNGIRLTSKEGYWGGYYQQWYLIPQGSGYIFLNKHFPNEQWVMDLSGNYSFDGNGIYSYPVNYSDGQIWSVYNRDEVQLQPAQLNANVEGSKVTFTWPNAYGAASYSMKIFTEEMWNNKTGPYMTVENVKSGESIDLSSGKYYAYIDSEDYYIFIMSNVVSFEIAKSNYTLIYDANGGTRAPSSQSGASSYIISLEQPIRSGYTFLGWSAHSIAPYASYKAGDIVSLSQDTVLFAVWEKNQDGEGGNTCPKCGTEFENETELNEHLVSCDGSSSTSGGFFSLLLNILYFIIGLIALPFTLLF